VIHGSGPADEVVKSWRLRLLNSSWAAERILAELKQSGREHVLVGESRPGPRRDHLPRDRWDAAMDLTLKPLRKAVRAA